MSAANLDRDAACVHGHYDCATTEGGTCADEVEHRLLAQHMRDSAPAIEREARKYAKSAGVTLDEAREAVREEYAQGYFDACDWRE